MTNYFHYPRTAGKWSQTLRWLKLAWQNGQETELRMGKVCTVKKGEQ